MITTPPVSKEAGQCTQGVPTGSRWVGLRVGQDAHLPQDRGDDARPERRECPDDRRPARALAGIHDQDVYLGRRASNAGTAVHWRPGTRVCHLPLTRRRGTVNDGHLSPHSSPGRADRPCCGVDSRSFGGPRGDRTHNPRRNRRGVSGRTRPSRQSEIPPERVVTHPVGLGGP
jgi:hypothetical protein